jgi:putative ABC transport system substrate-binding protein
MNRRSWALWLEFFPDNLKPVLSFAEGSKIENPKWWRIFAIAVALAICGAVVEAQQPQKVPRIGFLAGTEGPVVGAFQRGLRDLGYVEGKNIVVEYRYSEGKSERVPSLIAELVQFKVDVLVIIAVPALRAAKQATKTIPIVMVTTVDPVATGLVDSLARPGGNITGITRLTRELSGNRLELLMEILTKISRVGMLWSTSLTLADRELNEYEAAAGALKIPFQSLQVRGPNPRFGRRISGGAQEPCECPHHDSG